MAAEEFTATTSLLARIGQGVGLDKLTANPNVRQIVQVVEYWDKAQRLKNVLTTELGEGETCLVFCSTQGRAEYVVAELEEGCPSVDWVAALHGGKGQHDR